MSSDSFGTAMSPLFIISVSIISSAEGRLFWSYYSEAH